jgi:hypothetical protein
MVRKPDIGNFRLCTSTIIRVYIDQVRCLTNNIDVASLKYAAVQVVLQIYRSRYTTYPIIHHKQYDSATNEIVDFESVYSTEADAGLGVVDSDATSSNMVYVASAG